jgi:peptide/nickel transport system permease protein
LRSATQRLLSSRSSRIAVGALVILAVAAIVGPWFRGNGSAQLDIVRLKNMSPSFAHPFGTDQYSRDVLARVLFGARISLAVALLSVFLSMTVGTAYGMIAGFFGGRIDNFMMRLLDGFLSIPRVLLLIAILALWAPVRLPGLILLIGATGWFGVSRLVRAETIAARRLEYVDAARALGTSDARIIWRHLLPNVIAPVIVTATLAVGNVIALEAGLSYLGIGAREPTPSWGSIFFDGINFFAGNWWVAFFPGVAIVVTVLAFNVLGDALRDVLDPRHLHASGPEPVAIVTTSSTSSANDHLPNG